MDHCDLPLNCQHCGQPFIATVGPSVPYPVAVTFICPHCRKSFTLDLKSPLLSVAKSVGQPTASEMKARMASAFLERWTPDDHGSKH